MTDALIHIVLFSPKIPNNTGNIIRLCANTGAQLHLIKPLGFELDDTKLKRAGLDYHEYANLQVHEGWASAKAVLMANGVSRFVAMTTKFSRPFYGYDFGLDGHSDARGVAVVFGSETDGLPDDVRADIGADNWLRLPMLPQSRSLNQPIASRFVCMKCGDSLVLWVMLDKVSAITNRLLDNISN